MIDFLFLIASHGAFGLLCVASYRYLLKRHPALLEKLVDQANALGAKIEAKVRSGD